MSFYRYSTLAGRLIRSTQSAALRPQVTGMTDACKTSEMKNSFPYIYPVYGLHIPVEKTVVTC